MKVPEPLHSRELFAEKNLTPITHPLKQQVKMLLLISDFACKHLQLVLELLAQDDCQSLLQREDYFNEVRLISKDLSETHFMSELRKFRNKQLLRLLLLGLTHATTENIMQSWSDCADALILHVLDFCQQHQITRFGQPIQKDGKHAELYTLGMGKLGGRELNYSSDIDLIFAFSNEGVTAGLESISNEQFFCKMIQQFIQIMHQITREGFVFRVDLRLRPNGDSGPLVLSLAALETYYQEQGRDWERYAMVKARVITERINEIPSWFESLIRPFVYRRYVDFSVIESLRSMKSLIEREVQFNPTLNDIKRGRGGIREIEFIIQNFQLIRGGRLPSLRQQNALLALKAIKQENLLPGTVSLKEAYLFLRRLENALQSLDDQQTHLLPEDPIKRCQIALHLGYDHWETLEKKLKQYREIISTFFQSILGGVEAYEDETRILGKQLLSLWNGHIEQNMSINLLTSLGYENATHCFQMIHALKHGPRCRRLSQTARLRLDKFMVLLLTELIHCEKTNEVLLQMMHLIENILGRSAYLALLTENPKVLKELVFWFANSPFITSLLVSQPFLLDILLGSVADQSQEGTWKPPSARQLKNSLLEQLSHTNDPEHKEEILREFKLRHWLIAARSELHGISDAVRIGKFLTDVAEVIVAQVVTMAYEHLRLRYPEIQNIKSDFAIIAYGKLGSKELNYASDLDLVFLHRAKPEEEAMVTRLTQKILHMLTARSQSGILYSVDTRLRPSGAQGLLVSHMDAFINYQINQAWTWEHQALLKGRIIFGFRKIKQAFLQLKKTVLALPRDPSKLVDEVLSMRSKIEQHQGPARHALLDLEFLVQFLVLKLGKPKLALETHTLSQIRELYGYEELTKRQYLILKNAYFSYHQYLHHSILHPTVMQPPEKTDEISRLFDEKYAKN